MNPFKPRRRRYLAAFLLATAFATLGPAAELSATPGLLYPPVPSKPTSGRYGQWAPTGSIDCCKEGLIFSVGTIQGRETARIYVERGSYEGSALFCDYDGNGTKTLGFLEWNGRLTYANSYSPNGEDSSGAKVFDYPTGWKPTVTTPLRLADGDTVFCGDWDGDHKDTVGMKRGAMWYLAGANGTIQTVSYGFASDTGIVGDWDGNGTDTVGVMRRASTSDGFYFFLKNANSTGVGDLTRYVSSAMDGAATAVAGDWNADGKDTVGIVQGSQWRLDEQRVGGYAFTFGTGWAFVSA